MCSIIYATGLKTLIRSSSNYGTILGDHTLDLESGHNAVQCFQELRRFDFLKTVPKWCKKSPYRTGGFVEFVRIPYRQHSHAREPRRNRTQAADLRSRRADVIHCGHDCGRISRKGCGKSRVRVGYIIIAFSIVDIRCI